MQVCDLEPEGSPPYDLLKKYGGKFSLFQKIKMGGVGSPKIKYITGDKELDDFVEETAGSDIPYSNFEYLKNGILLRVNKTQYLKGGMIAFDEVENIRFTISNKLLSQGGLIHELEKVNEEMPQMEITLSDGTLLQFDVNVQVYLKMKKFFEKNKSVGGKVVQDII